MHRAERIIETIRDTSMTVTAKASTSVPKRLADSVRNHFGVMHGNDHGSH